MYYRYNRKPQKLDINEAKEEAKKIQQHIEEQYNWHANNRCTTAYSILDLRSTIEYEASKDLEILIEKNPYQIFLEKGRNYADADSDSGVNEAFVPFVILFAAIEDFSTQA